MIKFMQEKALKYFLKRRAQTVGYTMATRHAKTFGNLHNQQAISELFLASFSKRVLVHNHSY